MARTLTEETSLSKYSALLRSKLPVLAAVATIVAALCLGTHRYGSLDAAWQMLQIPVKPPSFADTRTITHSIDCVLSGQDPYVVRTFDPWHRVYNYPPIWLDARYLGITSRSSNLLGTIMSLATVSTLLLLFNSRTWLSAIVIFFAVLSRSVLFAVERGNTDQIIFFLLVFGLFLIERQKASLQPFLKGLLIVLLTVLKIYPIAAVVIFIRHRSGVLRATLTAIISVAALALTAGHSLPILLRNTPQDYVMAFGAYPLFISITRHVSHSTVAMLLLSALAVAAGMAWGHRLGKLHPSLNFDQARGSIAIACMAIFCFAFISGSSYDYRLIFLLGVLAYLVEDLNQAQSLRSLPAAVLMVLLLWKGPQVSLTFEVVDGLVFAVACAWLGNALLYREKRSDNPAFTRSEIPEST